MSPSPSWSLTEAYVKPGQAIIGVDEVGRGAWAGPVVAGAVILPQGLAIDGVNDSKQVRPATRTRLNRTIRARAQAVGLGWVAAHEVDEYGLSWAIAESGRRAVAELITGDHLIILDGKWNYLSGTHNAVTIVKADSLVVPVAAASIIAKVARDRYMALLELRHPGYGFGRHVGYGTTAHRRALDELGPITEHRCSYEPVGATRITVDAP